MIKQVKVLQKALTGIHEKTNLRTMNKSLSLGQYNKMTILTINCPTEGLQHSE